MEIYDGRETNETYHGASFESFGAGSAVRKKGKKMKQSSTKRVDKFWEK